MVFKGKAEVKYKDLVIEVFSTTELKEVEKRIAEMKKTYGNLENLKTLRSLSQKRENLLAKYSSEEKFKNWEALVREKEELEKEIIFLEKANEKIQNLEKERKDLIKQKEKLEREIKKLEEEAKKVVSIIGKIKGKIEEKENNKASLEEELNGMRFALDEIESAKEYAENLEKIEGEIKKLKEKVEKISEEIEELEKESSRCEGMLQRVPDEKRIEELYLQKKELEVKLSRLERIREVLFYSKKIISELSQKLQERWLKEFEENTSAYFEKITAGHYKKVWFASENLFFGSDEFEKKWKAERADGAIFSIDSLSDGTKVQLLLSARLALIQCFYPTKAFLIFDEPFAYFDEKRERNTLKILNHLAKEGWQIIIFRCKK